MIYVEIKNGKATNFSFTHEHGFAQYECRGNWKTMQMAWDRAHELNLIAGEDGEPFKQHFIATDSGAHVSPRYDVILAPAVGDAVSYSFNGDSYPDGFISKISASLRVVTTDTGSVYYRRKLSGAWIKKGGTWSMIRGHHNDRNPSF